MSLSYEEKSVGEPLKKKFHSSIATLPALLAILEAFRNAYKSLSFSKRPLQMLMKKDSVTSDNRISSLLSKLEFFSDLSRRLLNNFEKNSREY